MDRSFKFSLVPQVACSPWPRFIPSLWNSPFFLPNCSLKIFIFLHWWCRNPCDYTSNTDITVKCQLCCGIPLKPIASHLWEMDSRPVGLSSRASFSHPWFSTWWQPPHFLNKTVPNCPFKSVHAMPGLLRDSSLWTFNLMARLFSALGTLENQD